MRTTVTLDPDVAASVRAYAHERDISFKEALNTLLRAGLVNGRSVKPYKVKAQRMGLRPGINLDKALALASDLEDEELIRKMQVGK